MVEQIGLLHTIFQVTGRQIAFLDLRQQPFHVPSKGFAVRSRGRLSMELASYCGTRFDSGKVIVPPVARLSVGRMWFDCME